MKRVKPTRTVALLLLFACVFTLLAGCSTPATPTEPTAPTGTTPTNPTDPPGPKTYVANTFVNMIALSAVYSIDVKVDGDKVYLNDIPYNVTYTDNPGFSYGNVTDYQCTEGRYKTEYIFEKIATAEKCYVLEAEGDALEPDSPFRVTTAFDIDGEYYLIHGNFLGRLHYIKLATEDLPPAKTPPISEDAIALTAKPVAQIMPGGFDSSVAIFMDKDKISMGGIVYDLVLSDNINVSWESVFDFEEFFISIVDTIDAVAVLKKIKNSEKCYLLTRNEEQNTGVIRAMYDIDGTYYFVLLSGTTKGAFPYELYYANHPTEN